MVCTDHDDGLPQTQSFVFFSTLVSRFFQDWKMQSGEIEVKDRPNAFLDSWFPVRNEQKKRQYLGGHTLTERVW